MNDKINREKEFHNSRFSIENRDAQKKYYYAIKTGADVFFDKVRESSKNSAVLEYGAGINSIAYSLSENSRTVDSIDISEVAVQQLREKYKFTNVQYLVMNAEDLKFKSNSYDIVFGSGIIHHLDTEKAWREISRILKDGGSAIFWEPLGHNVLFKFYRFMTPSARTIDEHPLLYSDIKLAKKYFSEVSTSHYGLFSLISIPFRKNQVGKVLLALGERLDNIIFKLPILKWASWYCIVKLKK